MLRIKNLKGIAGGGQSLPIPVPLGLRQRRRKAIQWILGAAIKKRSRGSGKGQFAQKFAEELIAVVEGRSSAWDKRADVHRIAVSARMNIHKAGSVRRGR
jgi:small subunit ribosomal protein S7